MTNWSLSTLLASLHEDIEQRLAAARKALGHPGTKGDASEAIWLQLLTTYLPKRYQVASAHIVDSEGDFSDQIDVVIYDRQYTPLVFQIEGKLVIPAESLYAVFEAKQTVDASLVAYAQSKVASVRKLHRTSLGIPHAGGRYDPRPPQHIFGGLLTFESQWNPPLGAPLVTALKGGDEQGRLDIGCIAAHGMFCRDGETIALTHQGKPATAFLLELIARLQDVATVPMIDVRAYARWLAS